MRIDGRGEEKGGLIFCMPYLFVRPPTTRPREERAFSYAVVGGGRGVVPNVLKHSKGHDTINHKRTKSER